MTEPKRIPPLHVHVLWEPRFEKGQMLAEMIYDKLTRNLKNPLKRGLGIPVFFGRHSNSSGAPENPFKPRKANQTVIIILVDDEMLKVPSWKPFLEQLAQDQEDEMERTKDKEKPSCLLVLPVYLKARPSKFGPKFSKINVFSLDLGSWLGPSRDTINLERLRLNRQLLHSLIRFFNPTRSTQHGVISPKPITLFISHAKKDGLEIALAIDDWIHKNKDLKTFFDVKDIAIGSNFKTEIEGSIESAAFLAIQTDSYSTREWCRKEVLIAKECQRPILVINAVKQGEERSFPYLGNTPVFRWRGKAQILPLRKRDRNLSKEERHKKMRNDYIVKRSSKASETIAEIIDCLLTETLRHSYWAHVLENYPKNAFIFLLD